MKNVRCVFLSLVLLLLLLPGLVCATPAAPNLSLTTDGLNVTAAWTQSAEAQGYVLYFAPYPYIGEESIGSVDLGAETDISFYLWEDAAYFVAVTAYNGEGESGYSNVEYFIMGPPSPQWVDDDEDGFSEYQGDCKDDDAAISPQAVDLCGDGVDQDCVGGDAPCSAGEVAAPAFDPAAGEYINGLVVTLTSASEQAAIYYTTDGSDPTDASTLYEFPFWIASSQTIKAVAIEGDTVSGVSSAAYTIAYMASSPVVSPRGGTYDSPQTVTIATGEADADIYYTTDGSQPDSGSALYTAPVDVSVDQTISAVAIKDGVLDSQIITESFVITNQTFAPAFDTAPGIYFVPQQVGISSDSVGATIYYTTDGSPASAASLLYQAPIDISSTQTIRALAVKAGIADSVEVSNTYTIGNLSGTWSLMMITGENGCGQTVGQETSLGSVEIDHVGTMVTLASAFGSKTVEIGAGDLVWSTSFPVEQGVLDVDLTLNLVGEGDSFTGSVDFSFSGGIIACSGVGTLYGGKVE